MSYSFICKKLVIVISATLGLNVFKTLTNEEVSEFNNKLFKLV